MIDLHDELRGTLSNTICNATNYPERAQPYLLGSDMSTVLDRTSDAIIAAGYRKPRTVITVEELDALPEGTVVRDASGVVRDRFDDPDTHAALWMRPGGKGWLLSRNFKDSYFPATVLYEPEAS